MAPEDIKGKKRKGAADAAPKPKKQKKVDEAAAATKKSAKALNAAVKPIDDVPVNVKVTRKRAADLFNDHAPTTDKHTTEKKGNKKSKIAADVSGSKATAPDTQTEAAEVKEKAKKGSRSKKPKTEAEAEKVRESHSRRIKRFHEQPEIENAEEDDEDDQTAALLAGFESDNDEKDPSEDEGLDTEVKAKIDPSTRTQLEKAPQKTDEPGVIYVGRIPHGFYESQMRAYFKQFGKVTRLRVSRNKKTGAAKHYAFVEFASAEVADIVARTMNNYLMFGHILQCRVIPTAQVNPKLFDGANTRFKKDPRNKKEGAAMEHGVERAVWENRIAREQKKRAGRNKMLKDEMDYEFTSPALTSVEQVPKNTSTLDQGVAQQLLADAVQSEVESNQLGDTASTVKIDTKKPRKAVKAKALPDATPAVVEKIKPAVDTVKTVADKVEAVGESSEPVPESAATESKPKKSGKRSKSQANGVIGSETVVDQVEPIKEKKTKKAKKSTATVDAAASEQVEANTTVGAETTVEPAKEKTVKRAKKSKTDPVADTKEEAVVQSIVSDVVDKAKTNPKKVKATKKAKASS